MGDKVRQFIDIRIVFFVRNCGLFAANLLLLWTVTSFSNCYTQSVKVVFSENFDNTSSLDPWAPYISSGWYNRSPDNVLQAESGRGNVVRVNFTAGSLGSASGIGNYRIPLDSSYKELYLSWEYFIPSSFDYGYSDGFGGGKFFGGFAGGSMINIPNNDGTDLEGWASMLLFQDGFYSTYNYFKGSPYTSDGWPIGDRVTNLVKGQWRRITIRLKINDEDQANGLFEIFDNDILVYKQANTKVVNSIHPEFLIEHIYLNVFFGGGNNTYVCPVNQFMEFDNLVAFYYPPGSSGYRSGTSENGRVLEVPQASSYHPLPPNRFKPTNYTESSGTIQSHCAFSMPVEHPSYFETSTIQVSGASYLDLNVLHFGYDPTVSSTGAQQILKIYQGIGLNRVLVKTYQKNVLTTPGSIRISGDAATIEWQAGEGSHDGFVLSYNSDGTGSGDNFVCNDYVAKQGGVIMAPPAAPSELTVKEVGTKSASFYWKDNSNDESWFEIERRGPNNNNLVQTFKPAANTTSFSDASLQSNSTYSYRIRAYSTDGGYSAYSNAIEIKTAVEVPAVPTSLTLNSQTGTTAIIKWIDNSNNESWFEIERLGPNDNNVRNTYKSDANSTTFTDTDLQINSIYTYRIRAYNATSGYSSYSNSLEVNTKVPVPAAPSSLVLNSLADNSATIKWTDNSNNESWFEIERLGPNDNNVRNTYKSNANSTTFTDTDLQINSIYTYRIRAYNSTSGYSSYSNSLEVNTKVPVPAAPSSLVLNNLADNNATIKWTDNSNNESWFEIERLGPNDNNVRNTYKSDANSTTFTDAGLLLNSVYSYRIRAYNSLSGYSSYSNSLEVATKAILPPKAPSKLQSKEFTENSITIRWDDNSYDEKGFEISRSLATDETNKVSISVNANDTSFTDSGLEPSKIYIYTVKAVNDAGSSALSNKNIASTLSLAETKRIKDGLIAYYNFNFDPSYLIHDLSGYSEPLSLKIRQASSVQWDVNKKLEILSNTVITSYTSANKVVSALKKTGEITFECWIKPDEPLFSGTSRVISMGIDDEVAGFILDQHYVEHNGEKSLNYSVRLQTESTNSSGFPEIVQNNAINHLNLQHITYVRNKQGNEALFVNGRKTAEGFRPSDFSTWNNNFFLRLGNEKDLSRGWTGTLYTVAIYNKALDPDEVSRNYNAGPCDSLQNSNFGFEVFFYPNPVHDKATIKVTPVETQDLIPQTLIRILDAYGKIIEEDVIFNPLNEYTKTIDCKDYSKGIYFLQIISGNKQETSTFVIQ